MLQHVRFFDEPLSTVATLDHDLHRSKRKALISYFSKTRILAFEPQVHSKVNMLIKRLEDEYKGTGKVANLSKAFSCLSGDIVADFCYSWDQGFLSSSDFKLLF